MTVTANTRSSPIRVLWCGQSYNFLPGGLKGATSIPTVSMAKWPHVSYSVGPPAYGAQSWTDLTNVAAIDIPRLTAESPKTIAVLNGGQADLSVELNTGAQAAADQANYASILRGYGVAKVIGVTILRARSWTTGVNTQRVAFNNQILTTDAGLYDGVADPASDSRLDASVTPGNDTYFDAIGLHPTDAGGAIFATYVIPPLAAAIAALS